jgi:hypothetical protein
MPNLYSRAEWTELQLQFRPPRDGPVVSTRLRDYASPEDINTAITALEQLRRELSARARGTNRPATRRMSSAVQDAALAAMWAAADRRRIGWISRTCARAASTATTATMPACCWRVPQGVYSRSSARYELARAAALEDLRPAWTPPPVDDAREGHLRWMALRDIRGCREWLLPHGFCCKSRSCRTAGDIL